MKLAIIILSDPKNGQEALGRAFNGLALAAEARAVAAIRKRTRLKRCMG